jgi:hypothetical protein
MSSLSCYTHVITDAKIDGSDIAGWNTVCRLREDGVSVSIVWSCSSPTLPVIIHLTYLAFMKLILLVLDIKEVLLFPAMKPIETATNMQPTEPGPGGQI